jgi:hypothetical protein
MRGILETALELLELFCMIYLNLLETEQLPLVFLLRSQELRQVALGNPSTRLASCRADIDGRRTLQACRLACLPRLDALHPHSVHGTGAAALHPLRVCGAMQRQNVFDRAQLAFMQAAEVCARRMHCDPMQEPRSKKSEELHQR